jgi:hypothetical protein
MRSSLLLPCDCLGLAVRWRPGDGTMTNEGLNSIKILMLQKFCAGDGPVTEKGLLTPVRSR